MYPLDAFPPFAYEISKRNGKIYIWDVVRKIYVLVTPEEWVRQHLIHFLLNQKYPLGLISVEKAHEYNRLGKRTDVLVLDTQACPFLLAECKSPHVLLDNKVLYQVATYQKTIQAPYLLLTNGIQISIFECRTDGYLPLNNLPQYPFPNE